MLSMGRIASACCRISWIFAVSVLFAGALPSAEPVSGTTESSEAVDFSKMEAALQKADKKTLCDISHILEVHRRNRAKIHDLHIKGFIVRSEKQPGRPDATGRITFEYWQLGVKKRMDATFADSPGVFGQRSGQNSYVLFTGKETVTYVSSWQSPIISDPEQFLYDSDLARMNVLSMARDYDSYGSLIEAYLRKDWSARPSREMMVFIDKIREKEDGLVQITYVGCPSDMGGGGKDCWMLSPSKGGEIVHASTEGRLTDGTTYSKSTADYELAEITPEIWLPVKGDITRANWNEEGEQSQIKEQIEYTHIEVNTGHIPDDIFTIKALPVKGGGEIIDKRSDADYIKRQMGTPSPNWEVTDFEGEIHSLTNYKGKVLILDFWFSRCGPCIKQMPEIRKLADAFREQPVVVIGMNMDYDDNDARSVIEKMDLDYLNVKAHGAASQYKVQGYPTLIVLDQKGIIRLIHAGYSTHAVQKVRNTVERLLKDTSEADLENE